MKSKLSKRLAKLSSEQTKLKSRLTSYIKKCSDSAPDRAAHVRNLMRRVDEKLAVVSNELSKDDGSLESDYLASCLKQAEELLYETDEYTKPAWRHLTDSIFFVLLVAFLIRTFIFGLYQVPTGSAEPNLLVGDRIFSNKTAYYFSPVKRGDFIIFDNPEFPYASEGSFAYYWQRYDRIGVSTLGLSSGPNNVVKRVIGVPGDVIEGAIEQGQPVLYRNGTRIDEPYVNKLPLIGVRKTIGLISPKSFIAPLLPRFLVKQKKDHLVWYTYDPDKSLDEQPYYRLDPEEVAPSPLTGEPIYRRAGVADHYDRNFKVTVPQGKYWVQGDSRRNSRDSRSWGLLDHKFVHGRADWILWSINSEEGWWFIDFLKNPLLFFTKKLRADRFFVSIKNPLPAEEQN